LREECCRLGEERNACTNVVNLKRRLGPGWEDNIQMDAKEGGCEDVDWSSSGYGRVVRFCEHGNDPFSSINLGELGDHVTVRELLEQDGAM
jgi:hypothetical protein